MAVSPHGDLDGPPSVGTGSALKFSVEMTPVTCDADLGFAQVTLATQGGKLPSPNRQLEFDSALDFYIPSGAAGALRSLGLQLIESPDTDVSSDDSQSVACALQFMDEESGLLWASPLGKIPGNTGKGPHRAHTVRQHAVNVLTPTLVGPMLFAKYNTDDSWSR